MRTVCFQISILFYLIFSAPASGNEIPLIVIDAGHGGKDPGSISPHNGVTEKAITLSIAKKLNIYLNESNIVRAKLVRADDRYLSLVARRNVAVRSKANLFVSIHIDSAARKSANGASAYILSEGSATVVHARALAKRRHIHPIAKQMELRAYRNIAASVASDMLKNINQLKAVHDITPKKAGFAVLKMQGVPSILVELGFLSNKKDSLLLRQPSYQNQIVLSLGKAILQNFKQKN